MNIVDLISGQLSADVLGKLGGLVGASETQTRSATTAAVPALLDIFAKLASSQAGADQITKAISGLDLSALGNLAGLLGGGQASGLGNLGGNLPPVSRAGCSPCWRWRRSPRAGTSGTRARRPARKMWPSSRPSGRSAPSPSEPRRSSSATGGTSSTPSSRPCRSIPSSWKRSAWARTPPSCSVV
ncbi:MAG: DUF937 domain-containing protein [Planctomycetia bacterium]|nr:DUF937 domain-containing protein [Planctomycetia bacterium]